MISNVTSTAISGCDIRINYNNLCQIITAANQAVGPLALFYTDTQGTSWTPSVLPLVPGDLNHRHPSVDWTSDNFAWVVTVATSDGGIQALRLYRSVFAANIFGVVLDDWEQDTTFSFDHKNVDTPKMCISRSLNFDGKVSGDAAHPDPTFLADPTGGQHRIWIIWANDGSVFATVKQLGPGSPTSWQTPPFQISGSETTMAAGCDIKMDMSGRVYAFWHDTASKQLFVSPSIPNFPLGTFITPTPITTTYVSSSVNIPSSRNVPISISAGTYQTVNQAAGNPTDPISSFVYLVWTDLSADTGDGNKTRIWFARGTSKYYEGNFDMTWEPPVKINDQQSMNDQFDPRLAVDETNGRLVVVYYDTVGDDTRTSTNVFMQISEDNGMNWSDATQVTSAPTNEVTSDSWWQYGDYIGLATYAGTCIAAWTDRRSGLVEQIWG